MGKKRKHQKVKVKAKYTWTEEDMENALNELALVPGETKVGVAKKYGINKSLIRFRLCKWANNEEFGKPGRRFDFD